MTRITRAIGISAALVLLCGVATASYAGSGSSLILGHKNTASHTTTLRSKHGPALSLKGPKGKPPLAVSSTKQVTHLNASLLGGKSASSLETHATVFTLNASSANIDGFAADLPGLRHGALYQISYAVDVQATASIYCFVQQGPSTNYDLLGYGVYQGGYTTDSITGVARVPTHGDLTLVCHGDAGKMTVVDRPADDKTIVVATPIDVATSTHVTPTTN